MEKTALSVRANHWRQIVSECNSSSLTKTAWCLENGIRFRSFMYWQKKLRNEELERLPALQQPAELSRRGDTHAFVDMTGVMSLDRPGYSPVGDMGSSDVLAPKVMVRIGNSCIYIGDLASEDLLCRVMRAVRNA